LRAVSSHEARLATSQFWVLGYGFTCRWCRRPPNIPKIIIMIENFDHTTLGVGFWVSHGGDALKSISTARPNFLPKSQNLCHESLQDWRAQNLRRPMFGQVPKARAFPPRKMVPKLTAGNGRRTQNSRREMAGEPKTYGGKISQIQLSMIPGQYSASSSGYTERHYLPRVFYVLGLQPRFHRFRSTHGRDGCVSTRALCFQLERKLG
jgi:hypothetical protein